MTEISSSPNLQTVMSSTTLAVSLFINGFILFALIKLPATYRFQKSERYLLASLAVCGLGTAITTTLPTFIACLAFPNETTWPNEVSNWCKFTGMTGIIFMTASSWFVALLCINRCIIISRAFDSKDFSTKRFLLIHAAVWFSVTVLYVIMYVMVDADVGIADYYHLVYQIQNNTNTPLNVLVNFKLGNISSVRPSFVEAEQPTFFTNSTTNETSGNNLSYKVRFLTFDPLTAMNCGPNWRLIPNYFYPAVAAFFFIPICCLSVSYFIITRIANKHVKQIRSIKVKPSISCSEDGTSQDQSNREPFRNVMSASKHIGLWITHATLTAGVVGLSQVTNEKNRQKKSSTSDTNLEEKIPHHLNFIKTFRRVGKQKVYYPMISVVCVFLVTWTTYVSYFIVESNSYSRYIRKLTINNATDQNPWTPAISPTYSYVMTWFAQIGQCWSVLVFALLNRKLKFSIGRHFQKLSFSKDGSISNRKSPRCSSNKVAPVFSSTLPGINHHHEKP